ncbi:MAG: chemotaxis protein CheW [Bdellovibrionales bacterium]|jgi:purine-binding chemotaxis protein CheW|nr:chemotaxis protein CheW [Bdellovibrionales bacterium]
MTNDLTQKRKEERQIFGSFLLGGSEFALAVSHVQEVVNAPETYTVVPLAPSYLKGLFNLRGTVIPVLDLCGLLNVQPVPQQDVRKIAIVEMSDCCVGLLFDQTGEVFRSQEDERSDFDSTDLASVVSGVFKKEDGKRIVQILDVQKLFKLQNVPKDGSGNRLGRGKFAAKRGTRKQCISFVVGPAKCALPISGIQEILKVSKIDESALGGGFCIGTIDLRGITVPIIDFASLLEYRAVDSSKEATSGDRRIVVMRLETELFGLMVDSVDSIISYFQDELIAFPLVEQNRAEMFLGCITGRAESDILLLDHQKILSHAEINQITRGHSRIYQSSTTDRESKRAKGGRKSYIRFALGHSYAVAIDEVCEIIDFPKELLQPPGVRKHVCGVLNLRGRLVTIINARSMYDTEPFSGPVESQKVLIFERKGAHFGLVVDGVDSIVSFLDADKIQLPSLLYQNGGMTLDLAEAVEVADASGQRQNMLVLSVDAVSDRAIKSIAA